MQFDDEATSVNKSVGRQMLLKLLNGVPLQRMRPVCGLEIAIRVSNRVPHGVMKMGVDLVTHFTRVSIICESNGNEKTGVRRCCSAHSETRQHAYHQNN